MLRSTEEEEEEDEEEVSPPLNTDTFMAEFKRPWAGTKKTDNFIRIYVKRQLIILVSNLGHRKFCNKFEVVDWFGFIGSQNVLVQRFFPIFDLCIKRKLLIEFSRQFSWI